METKKEKTTARHKVISVIGIVLCVILIPMLIMNVTLIVKSYVNPDEVPSLGGVTPMIVLTGSMEPEIMSGDIIFAKSTPAEEVKVGDVITFFDPASSKNSVLTHRVIEITTVDGGLAFKTQGDANNTADKDAVPAEKLIGVYTMRLPKLGNVAMFMQTTPGLIVCVGLPLVLLVVYDVIRRKKYEKANKEDTDALLKELEELKAAAAANTAQSQDEGDGE